MSLTAAQLIYANVERGQSPRRQRGLQTLYYTRKDDHDRLTSSEVLNLETRLSHEAKRYAGPRHLFFRTKTNKYALVRFLPLDEADRFDRFGRYFAHALVFRPEAFAELACNPFAAFDAPGQPFASRLEQSIALGDFATGDIPPVTLDCPGASAEGSTSPPWSEGLSPSALRWLILAASQGPKLLDMRRVIALRGEPLEVFAFLRGLFAWLPSELRLSCTFDTTASEQTAEKLGQWAVGLAEAPVRRTTGLLLFALQGENFIPIVPLNPESSFDRWAVLDNGVPLVPRLRQAQAAYDLMIASKEGNSSKINPGAGEVIDDYHAANRRDFDESIAKTLSRLIEFDPPAWLVEQARDWMASPGDAEERARAWVSGPSIDRVLGWVVKRLRKNPVDFKGLALESLVQKDRGTDGPDSRFLIVARNRSLEEWGELWSTMSEMASTHPSEWEKLGKWLIRTVANSIELSIYQVPGAVTFGFLIRGAAPLSLASCQVLGALNKGVVQRHDLIPVEDVFEKSMVVPSSRGELWLQEITYIIRDMSKLIGTGWRFLPTEGGCFFGMDYEPPPEIVGNIDVFLSRFEAPEMCRDKVTLLVPLTHIKKKGLPEPLDGEVYPLLDPDCLRLFKLLFQFIRSS